MTRPSQPDLVSPVMDAIDRDTVAMRPAYYFVLGSILLSMGLVTVLLTGMFAVNSLYHSMSYYQPFDFLLFGDDGLLPFLAVFPWVRLLVSLGLVWLGLRFIRAYDAAYSYNFGVVVLLLVGGVMAGSVGLDAVGIRHHVSRLPSLQRVYIHDPYGKRWLIGTVATQSSELVQVVTLNGDVIGVRMLPTIKASHPAPETGAHVRAVGLWDGDIFMAQQLRSD